MSTPHRVWAEIDCDAISHNFGVLRNAVSKHTKIMAVLKANAYGHGAINVARILQADGLDAIGVGDSQEALELRQAGIMLPILILGAVIPDEIEIALRNNIEINLHSIEMLREIEGIARTLGQSAKIQLAIDSGMGRLGAQPEHAGAVLQAIQATTSVELTGINTHFSSAGESDDTFTMQQLSNFNTVVDLAHEMGFENLTIHAANHTATLRYPQARFDMVRPGLALYGLSGAPTETHPELERVLSLKTQVAYLKDVAQGTPISYDRLWHAPKDTRIATLPIGYNDGYPIALSNNNHVLIHGQQAPVVGRVSMDYIMVDVGHIPEVLRGDIVTVIGKDGDDEIHLEDLASKLATVPYEVTCGLGRRVKRVYVGRTIALPQAA